MVGLRQGADRATGSRARPVRGPRAAPLRAVRREPVLTGVQATRPVPDPHPSPVRRAGGPCSQELTFRGHTAGATVGALGAFDFPAWTYYNGASADGRYPALI